MNISGHKYGLCYPGIGWVIWRDETALPEELVFHVNYLGGDMATFNLNFSRPASGVLAQYYNLLRLGREGYTNVMKALKDNADYIREKLSETGLFDILSDDRSLPLVAWAVRANDRYMAFDLSDKLRERGWIVPAYTMPADAQEVTCLRAVVREGMSRDLADNLIDDIAWAAGVLHEAAPKMAADYVHREKQHGIC
jgi:glutamate decarboxylase